MVEDTKKTIVRKWSIVQVFVASGGSNWLPLWALLAPKDRIGRKTQSFVLLAWRERLSVFQAVGCGKERWISIPA